MGGTTIVKGGRGAQCTLTPEGFEYLLDVGILKPSCVDTATILDKGKADFLAKFLVSCLLSYYQSSLADRCIQVCVQAAWMILQCILRRMNDLPVTLIELNALSHVVIALVMYFFCKPSRIIVEAILTYLQGGKSPSISASPSKSTWTRT